MSGRGAAAAPYDPRWLRQRLRELGGTLRHASISVAFSGGADSTALVLALSSLRRAEQLHLRLLHVNHQLQPAALDWERQALRLGATLGIEAQVLTVTVPLQRGSSPEAAARTVRYQALRAALRPEEWLLTAHHQEDQLETLLLQLLRGAGLPGLAAMPARQRCGPGWLIRPLLPVPRSALLAYLQRQGASWSEDPTNQELRYDRNFLRHEILPRLQQRWPGAAATVSRSAAHAAEAQQLLDELAKSHWTLACDGQALQVAVLRRLSAAERRNLLRYWLRHLSLPVPGQLQLREITESLLAARSDARPRVSFPGGEVWRHAGRLHARAPQTVPLPKPRHWDWKREPRMLLPGSGTLALLPDRHGSWRLDALPARLGVRFRTGGERLLQAGGRKPLKNLLQENAVAPWLRERLPLLYAGRRLIAAADLWLDSRYAAGPDCLRRGRLHWEPSAEHLTGNAD